MRQVRGRCFTRTVSADEKIFRNPYTGRNSNPQYEGSTAPNFTVLPLDMSANQDLILKFPFL
jgi:hypothetical protein